MTETALATPPPLATSPGVDTLPRWVAWLSMFALALIAYLPAALGARFIQFDDPFFFDPRHPEFAGDVGRVLSQPIANAWLPVSHLSLWFDWMVAGRGAWFSHLHSLALHALCAVVLVRLLERLRVRSSVALVAAGLFVVHPALAESVAWASSRKDVLSGLFVLLALERTARHAQRPGLGAALLLAVLTALAMGSKATAVVSPLLAAGVLWLVGGPRARWGLVLVQFGVTIVFAMVHQGIAIEQGTMAGGDTSSRLAQVPGAFAHYLGTAFWPARLNVLYPEVQTLEAFRAALPSAAVVLGGFLVVGVVAAAVRRTRLVGFGMLAFVVALLPFNTAFPASSIAAADRYLYLALPWLALVVAAAIAALPRPALAVAPAVLALCSLWLCGSRSHDFGDDDRLWLSSLAVDDDNAVAHYNLAYARLGQRVVALDEVRPHLEAAVRSARYPVHELWARFLLQKIAMAEADYAAAARHARGAISAAEAQLRLETSTLRQAQAAAFVRQARLGALEPLQLAGEDAEQAEVLAALRADSADEPDVIAFEAMHELRGRQPELLALGRDGKAPRLPDDDPAGAAVDERLAAARELHPEHAGLWLAQALWDRARDRVFPAARCLTRAAELEGKGDGDGITAHLELARMWRERSQYAAAERAARQGLERRPDPQLMQELALALVGLNRFDEAELHLEAYLRLTPDDAAARKILANLLVGRAYEKLSDQSARGQVRKLIDRVMELNPNETKAHLVLGRIAREERRMETAARHFEQAYRLLPSFADARQQYAECLAALGYGRLLQGEHEGAVDAWIRCIEVAPEGFDTDEIRGQLKAAWNRFESRGIERLGADDLAGAEADFRRCLRIDPQQHWGAWLLATVLFRRPDADLVELERLARQACVGQREHGLDSSRQAYVLATTLSRLGRDEDARQVAAEYLAAPADDVEPQVLAALQQLAGG